MRAAYRELVKRNGLRADSRQEDVVALLEGVHDKLRNYAPSTTKRDSFFHQLTRSTAGVATNSWFGTPAWLPKVSFAVRSQSMVTGLYIWGGVGAGKTMLMDLFFQGAPISRKRRVHFHEFMLEVHQKMHKERHHNPAYKGDPLPAIADEIAAEAWLLCFDEFQVTDVADALILRRLFEMLFDSGCVVIATSNRPPCDLYKNGINREFFLPFIDLLEDRCSVSPIGGKVDYRMETLTGRTKSNTHDSPSSPSSAIDPELLAAAAQSALNSGRYVTSGSADKAEGGASGETSTLLPSFSDNAMWQWWLAGRGAHTSPLRVPVMMGRYVEIPAGRYCDDGIYKVAMFTFNDLCAGPPFKGASDYIAICQHLDGLIIEKIPQIDTRTTDAGRRFITLVDVLYEHDVSENRTHNSSCGLLCQPHWRLSVLLTAFLCTIYSQVKVLFEADTLLDNFFVGIDAGAFRVGYVLLYWI
jgi:cell division protein ZapE